MYRPSNIPARLGFYLLLLFSFTVSVFPEISFLLAAAAVLVWIIQLIIFRQPALTESQLFYPIAGFAFFSLIELILSRLYSFENPSLCVGIYSAFYFVVLGFVPTQEKRKMIIWTFLSGVILAMGINILSNLGNEGLPNWNNMIFDEYLLILIIITICLGIAYYSEAKGYRERIFFALIFIPIGFGILIIDKVAAMILLVLLLIIGLVRERSILIGFGIAAIVILSGIGGLDDSIQRGITSGEYLEKIQQPLRYIEHNFDKLATVEFYGHTHVESGSEEPILVGEPFFIALIQNSGPPALLFFVWVLFELGRRDFAKIRKLGQREERAYHLATYLTLATIILVNIYGSSFDCSPAILAFWMIMGMAEI